jgi:quinol monooxygenase YgiN
VGDEPVQALLAGRRALLVRLTCEPGRRPALLDMLNTYADGLSEEPGTELFVVSLDPDDDTIVWLYEMFKDEDAETAHRSSAGFAAMMHEMPALIGSLAGHPADGPAAHGVPGGRAGGGLDTVKETT